MRAITDLYAKSMSNRVRKKTEPSITFAYSGATTGYIGGSANPLISLKKTESVDILGRSLPTETLVVKARMGTSYDMASPSGAFGSFRTGATVTINFLQVLDDGTSTHGCGTASNYIDTYKCTQITRDRKDNTYTFTCKSKLTCATNVYKYNFEYHNLRAIANAVITAAGLTSDIDFSTSSFTIPSNQPGYVIPYDGVKYTDALQKIAQSTGRAIYTYNGDVCLKQWNLAANPTRWIAKGDYFMDGISRTDNDALKQLTITSSKRAKIIKRDEDGIEVKDAITGWTQDIFSNWTVEEYSTRTFVMPHTDNKAAYCDNIEEPVAIDSRVTASITSRGVYSTTIVVNNPTGASSVPVGAAYGVTTVCYGNLYETIKSDTIYNSTEATGQEIKIAGNEWIYPTHATTLKDRYVAVYGYKTQIKLSYRGLQELYPGDMIAVEDEDGVWQKVIITGTVLSFDGALSGEITGLMLGTITANASVPFLYRTSSRKIADSEQRLILLPEREAHQTNRTATEIDTFIETLYGE